MTRDLTYADHEFVNVRITPRLSDQINSEANVGVEYAVQDGVLGLDNDELAMLSFIDASFHCAVSGFSQDQDSNGMVQATAEIGANLGSNDYLGQVDADEGVTVVDGGNGVDNAITVANDEPGIWAVLNASPCGGFKDLSGDGGYYAGNSAPDGDHQRREFYSETMSGPYIDSTDNITIGMYFDKDSMGAELQAELTAQMAFVIFEYDQRRAEFGPVPGGT